MKTEKILVFNFKKMLTTSPSKLLLIMQPDFDTSSNLAAFIDENVIGKQHDFIKALLEREKLLTVITMLQQNNCTALKLCNE